MPFLLSSIAIRRKAGVREFTDAFVSSAPVQQMMTRVTTVSRVTGNAPPRDYTVVTVRVTEPTMGPAIDATTIVAQP